MLSDHIDQENVHNVFCVTYEVLSEAVMFRETQIESPIDSFFYYEIVQYVLVRAT